MLKIEYGCCMAMRFYSNYEYSKIYPMMIKKCVNKKKLHER